MALRKRTVPSWHRWKSRGWSRDSRNMKTGKLVCNYLDFFSWWKCSVLPSSWWGEKKFMQRSCFIWSTTAGIWVTVQTVIPETAFGSQIAVTLHQVRKLCWACSNWMPMGTLTDESPEWFGNLINQFDHKHFPVVVLQLRSIALGRGLTQGFCSFIPLQNITGCGFLSQSCYYPNKSYKDFVLLQLAGPDWPEGCRSCREQDRDCDQGTERHSAHTHWWRSQPAGSLDVPRTVWQSNGWALPWLHERYHRAPCLAFETFTRVNKCSTSP